jgi:cobalamin biosynthesis protein CbiD
MYTADLEIRFENGSTGAKVFQSYDKEYLYQQVHDFVKSVIDYAREKNKNLVTGHTVKVTESN